MGLGTGPALFVAVGAWAQTSSDSAEIGAARLAVSRAPGAEECPGAPALRAELEPLGIDAASVEPADIHVEIRPLDDGFGAYVSVTGADGGVRALEAKGPGCARLKADLLAALALLLDRRRLTAAAVGAAVAPPPSPPAPPPSASATPVTSEPPAEPPPAPPKTTSSIHGRAALGGGVALALVGSPAAYVDAGFWLEGQALSLGLRAFSTVDVSSELGSGAVDVRLTGGRLDGCLSLFGSARNVEGRLCATAALASLRGEASGYAATLPTAARPWYALGLAGLVGGTVTGPLTWTVDASVLVPLHRESFSIAPLGPAFETPYAGGMLGIALGMHIW